MAREYAIVGNNVTVANQAVTLAFMRPPPSRAIRILRAWVSFSANATAAMQRVQLTLQVSPFPTLVAQAPVKLREADGASLILGGTDGSPGTAGINASAEGAGAKTVLLNDAFNVIAGWTWKASAGETIDLKAGSPFGFGLHFPAAPATLTNWHFGVWYRELGL
jgi:hypothetical protein